MQKEACRARLGSSTRSKALQSRSPKKALCDSTGNFLAPEQQGTHALHHVLPPYFIPLATFPPSSPPLPYFPYHYAWLGEAVSTCSDLKALAMKLSVDNFSITSRRTHSRLGIPVCETCRWKLSFFSDVYLFESIKAWLNRNDSITFYRSRIFCHIWRTILLSGKPPSMTMPS